jgi:hypothetical protein
MNKQSAIKLLDDTFNSDFNINNYLKFINELFNKFSVNQKSWNVWKEYEEYIESYQLLGSYSQSKDVIDVLVVKLKKASSRDRARTMQRNFIAKYLGNANKNGALVAFYGDDTQDWRFSFVKMEYNLVKDEKGTVKPVQELTPAKRYSFLVGVNEPNHTCASQFLKLIREEEINPSLLEIEEAFSIDNVTKEFFNEYKELFLELEESLRDVISKDNHIKEEFDNKGISSVDFAKKLLGQIVFIYFLQKKGWLGVVKDEQGNFKKWGTGSKKFMRTLFDKDIVPYDNYFNDILEPLFYEALATERDNSYYSRFKCKIPFLNGGLFEPLNDYDWAGTEIVLDNTIFDRILKTFDRFNFTVKEDEPLEKEVAVDPEMLGKVFENLLEVKDRKSKGAFYTPREIVHYMCQQSLINYLETNTVIDRKDIEKFIQLGDVALDMIIKEQEQIKKYGRSYDIKEELVLPKAIREDHQNIDFLLKSIKVVDPAVGSGAFPIGMLNEIVKARSILSIYFDEKRNDYDLKREIIENCLYGVDIESSAVDITKLRFWLSLIVDEDDMKNIKPLPNLDHKIMCGNSLLEEFEGVKLFNEKLLGEVKKDNSNEIKQIENEIKDLQLEYGKLANGEKSKFTNLPQIKRKITLCKNKIKELNKKEINQVTLFQSKSEQKINSLKHLQKQFFNEQRKGVKKELRAKIDQIEWDLIEETLKEQGNEGAMQKLKEYKKNKSKPFFLWKLYFAEVFQSENPGFDVVIGNPPYISYYSRQSNHLPNKIRTSFVNNFECMENERSRINAIQLFIEKGILLSKNKGILAYIIDKTFLNEKTNIPIRKFLLSNSKLLIISPFLKNVFDATVDPMILITKKEFCKDYAIKIIENEFINHNLNLLNLNINVITSNSGYEIKADLLNLGVDFNKIFKNTKLLKELAILKSGANIGGHKDEFLSEIKENDFFKPLLKGSRNIKRYRLTWDVPLYIRYDHNLQYKINDEAQKNVGTKKKVNLVKLGDGHIDKRYEKEKLIIRQSSSRFEATYDDNKFYCMYGLFIINQLDLNINLKYLLALINSNLYTFYGIKSETIITGHKKQPQIRAKGIKELPIKQISPEQQKPFINLVDQILSITKDDDYLDNEDKQLKVKRLEKEIDQLVYKLYDLTSEEIKIVEEFNEK